jgi:Bacterial membrane flanked domain.
VETIGVEQTILGRILNYGTIIFTGTGGTKGPFKGIAKPIEFRERVQSQLA